MESQTKMHCTQNVIGDVQGIILHLDISVQYETAGSILTSNKIDFKQRR